MSIKTIITRGFGNGSFLGAIKDVVLRGFGIGAVIIAPDKTFGVLSIIQERGLGVDSLMTVSLGVSSGMDSSQGVLSTLQSRGLGVSSAINSSKGVESDI